jgi:hypothetical protein
MDKPRALDGEVIPQRRSKRSHEKVEGTTPVESAIPRAPQRKKFSHNDQAWQAQPLNDQAAATPELLAETSPKPATWRIRGIQKVERDVAIGWLREQAKELGYPEGQGFSLAADGEHELCATLTSYGRPKIRDGRDWHVDDDFIGFTPLGGPEDAELDIVAITGLGGHAVGSFRSANGKFIWLRDSGPREIPKARFVTYGYDTKVVNSDSSQGVAQLARTLLERLVDFRDRTKTSQRPMCFFCHSLGGVVLKDALVLSSRALDPDHVALYETMTMTFGLVMMGVPNFGLRHEQLRTIVRRQANENFVSDLLTREDSQPTQYLRRLTDDFVHLCRQQQPPYKIISFYETEGSPTIEVSPFLCLCGQSISHGYSTDFGRWKTCGNRAKSAYGPSDLCRAYWGQSSGFSKFTKYRGPSVSGQV